MKNYIMTLLIATLCGASAGTDAAPVTYPLDPAHTFPSFEADHMGISVWRGKFNKTSGTLMLDKAASTGTVEAVIDIASVDFGLDSMHEHAVGPGFFDIAKYPQAIYKGELVDFVDGAPTRVSGQLTLHGVTRPLDLNIHLFKCIPHPMLKRDCVGRTPRRLSSATSSA